MKAPADIGSSSTTTTSFHAVGEQGLRGHEEGVPRGGLQGGAGVQGRAHDRGQHRGVGGRRDDRERARSPTPTTSSRSPSCSTSSQRRYRVSERIHRITPVVLVAQEVPTAARDRRGLAVTYDWILRRVLLDDSFVPALNYLCQTSSATRWRLREMQPQHRFSNAMSWTELQQELGDGACSGRPPTASCWSSSLLHRAEVAVAAAAVSSAASRSSATSSSGAEDAVDGRRRRRALTCRARGASRAGTLKEIDRAHRRRGAGSADAAGARGDRAQRRLTETYAKALAENSTTRPRSTAAAHARQAEHPLLHAGHLEPRAARPAILPAAQDPGADLRGDREDYRFRRSLRPGRRPRWPTCAHRRLGRGRRRPTRFTRPRSCESELARNSRPLARGGGSRQPPRHSATT